MVLELAYVMAANIKAKRRPFILLVTQYRANIIKRYRHYAGHPRNQRAILYIEGSQCSVTDVADVFIIPNEILYPMLDPTSNDLWKVESSLVLAEGSE